MGRNFSSGLLAGVVAATIWMAIGLWQGMPTETVGLWALILLVATVIITTVVAGVVSRSIEGSAADQRA